MSGGAFNYFVYAKERGGILDRIGDLRDMEQYCRSIGKHDAADELYQYLLFLETVMRRMTIQHNRLSFLLRQVEWNASGDVNADAIDVAYEELIKDKKEQKGEA